MSAPFLIANLIPKEYRPLLSAISPAAFSVVDWKQLMKDAPVVLRRLNNHEGVESLAKTLGPLWAHSIQTVKKSDKTHSLKNLKFDKKTSENLGLAALEFYFAQIHCPQGLFLDLRLYNFSIDEKSKISFTPNGFWVQWQEPFRLGLLNIYTGYYKNNSEQLDLGLSEVGLVHANMSKEKIAEIRSMLLSHIGGNYQNQQFLISDFTASFERFFQFLINNKIRLGIDFLYLGIYLASLYHGLQELGGTYDVQKCFLESANKNAKYKING